MILDRLREVAADVFDLAPEAVPADAAAGKLEAWTSLRHLQLMTAVESEFGIRLSTEEMLSLQSLPQLAECLKRRGVAT
jgi:acyl carrier protein